MSKLTAASKLGQNLLSSRYSPLLCELTMPPFPAGTPVGGLWLLPGDSCACVELTAVRVASLRHAVIDEQREARRFILRAGCRDGPRPSGSRSERVYRGRRLIRPSGTSAHIDRDYAPSAAQKPHARSKLITARWFSDSEAT